MPSTSLGVFVTHPVQYHVPLWRILAQTAGLDVHVHYFSRHGLDARVDPGFDCPVAWDVDLLSGYDSTFLCDAPIERVDRAPLSRPGAALDDRFDAVLLHGYRQTFAKQIVGRRKRAGYGVVMRGEFSDRSAHGRNRVQAAGRRFILSRVYRNVDAFCYVGHDAKAHLLGCGLPAERLFFSPYSVDAELFASQRARLDRLECRRRLGIAESDVVFMYSGKMIPRKRPDFVADLALQLASHQNFRLIMVGDGPMLPAVKRRLAGLTARNQAVLPGFVNQSELGQYYGAADAFVFPSQFDTWGLVVNEAMHFGLPCFVSDKVGCGPDLVTPGVTGQVLPANDLSAWTTCLRGHLDDSADLHSMGEQAARRAERYTPNYSAEGIIQAVEYAARRERP